MFLKSILFYLSWPLLIVICYYAIIFALSKFEKKAEKAEVDK
jgi:hypothetical protein